MPKKNAKNVDIFTKQRQVTHHAIKAALAN